ncbi:MAG: alpha-galactosidase, partial [Treponema sp.]|nr:alpha-galactosidase [Treponema sp.]
RVQAEVFAPGKAWKTGEPIAVLNVFFARTFFGFKDALKTLYRQENAFGTLDFLRSSLNEPAGKEPAGKRNLPGGYESWYNHYNNINQTIILDDLQALAETENLLKLRYIDRKRPLVFQIDDGWEWTVGEWEVNTDRFPLGLKHIASRIEDAGFIPGLWLAPFLVTRRCRVFREKPEWLLRETPPLNGKRGKPVVAGFNHLWDKQYYCLDISRQDVLEYLKAIIDRAIDDWGFRYLKIDFLYTGLFAGAFAEGGVPHEHYERACKIMTSRTSNTCGLPVAYLGCGLPMGLSYRHFPLSRTGADTREEWDWNLVRLLGHVGRPSAWMNLRNTIGRTHLDGAVYISDPDVIFLRTKNCKLTETEKELIALVNFLLAGQIMFSDDPLHSGSRHGPYKACECALRKARRR